MASTGHAGGHSTVPPIRWAAWGSAATPRAGRLGGLPPPSSSRPVRTKAASSTVAAMRMSARWLLAGPTRNRPAMATPPRRHHATAGRAVRPQRSTGLVGGSRGAIHAALPARHVVGDEQLWHSVALVGDQQVDELVGPFRGLQTGGGGGRGGP